MSGWISLHRKIRQNPVFYDLQLLRLWIICLTEASHKEHKILVGKQSVNLQAGQFVTGRFELGMKYNEGLKPKDRVQDITVWRWLKTLEELDFVIIESNNKYSLCTVAKWAYYQNNDQQNDQQMINKRSANDQQMITNNNGNKGNNDNKGNKKEKIIVDADASKRFIKPTIQQVFEYCQERKNNVDPEKWYDHYESNGWKVGKNAMKDWKAAVRTWEKNSSTSLRGTSTKNSRREENNKNILLQTWSDGNEQERTSPTVNGDLFSLPDGRTY